MELQRKDNTTMRPQLDYTFSKTNSAPTTAMTNNFLSLPGQEVHFIF